MRCPHCNTAIAWQPGVHYVLGYDEEEAEETNEENPPKNPFAGEEVVWDTLSQSCPECGEPIIFLRKAVADYNSMNEEYRPRYDGYQETYMAWPRSGTRPCPSEVPPDIREDFEEAVEVLEISPKASAALSRRCLQNLLKEHAGVKKKDLIHQIEEVIAMNILSSEVASQLDAVRNIGNFAAHPQKSNSTGEILPVEPHEAQWNLDVLEDLFDHFFVKPAKNKRRKEEFNKKLAATGKPLIP